MRRSLLALLATLSLVPAPLFGQLDPWLRDRGEGIPTSMFGSYIRPGELLIYPFFEYYRDSNSEYKPAELGYDLDVDFRGKFRATEGLLFLGYGLSDRFALEMEVAVIDASLETAANDSSTAPDRITASGIGDVEGQLRARWIQEGERRPEFFSYLEAVAPVQTEKALIATTDWEFKFGSGLIRGFSWGTVTLRAALQYDLADQVLEPGEYALEYLRRLSPNWRVYAGVEGTQDEVELITEIQARLADRVTLKLNNAVGLTSKAVDWAPEVGILFSLGHPR